MIALYDWLVVSTPLKNMKVKWDYDIPKIWKIKFMFQTTNQMMPYEILGLKTLKNALA